MTAETLAQIAIFIGTVIGVIYTTINTYKTKNRVADQSQKMQAIAGSTDELKQQVTELRTKNVLLEESRELRGREIEDLKGELRHTNERMQALDAQVKTLTDEKAEVVRERDELRGQLNKAADEINGLKISVIKLEARLEAEQNANKSIAQPILDLLTKIALHQPLTAEPPQADAA